MSQTVLLNSREEKFVKYYLTEDSGAKAARMAGYNSKYSHTQAYRMLQRDKIRTAIAAERERLELESGLTPSKMMWMMLESYNLARDNDDATGMLAAAKEMGVLCGYYD